MKSIDNYQEEKTINRYMDIIEFLGDQINECQSQRLFDEMRNNLNTESLNRISFNCYGALRTIIKENLAERRYC